MKRAVAITTILIAGIVAGVLMWPEDVAPPGVGERPAPGVPSPAREPSAPVDPAPEQAPNEAPELPDRMRPERPEATRAPGASPSSPSPPVPRPHDLPSIHTPGPPIDAPAAATPNIAVLPPAPRDEPSPPPPEARVPSAEAAEAASAAPSLAIEATAIQRVIRQYESAFNTLDVDAAAAVWPSIDRRAITRAFTSMASQQLTFDDCSVALSGSDATVRCSGTVTFVPRVGRPTPQAESHVWTIRLRGAGEAWQIIDVSAE